MAVETAFDVSTAGLTDPCGAGLGAAGLRQAGCLQVAFLASSHFDVFMGGV